MVKLGKRFFAQVDSVVAFLSLNNREKLGQEARHTSDDVNRRTGVQLVNPVDHH